MENNRIKNTTLSFLQSVNDTWADTILQRLNGYLQIIIIYTNRTGQPIVITYEEIGHLLPKQLLLILLIKLDGHERYGQFPKALLRAFDLMQPRQLNQ